MYKLKKFLPVLLIAAMLLCSGPAFAQSRYGLTFTPVTADQGSILPAGTWVYGIDIYASSAAAAMGLYDVATLGEATDANLSAPEVGEATQYASEDRPFIKPIYFSTAVTVVINNGVGGIWTGQEPN